MKTNLEIIVLLLALNSLSAAVAQDYPSVIPPLPKVGNCGTKCITDMLRKAPMLGCPGTKVACLCTTSAFENGMRDCSFEACGDTVRDDVLEWLWGKMCFKSKPDPEPTSILTLTTVPSSKIPTTIITSSTKPTVTLTSSRMPISSSSKSSQTLSTSSLQATLTTSKGDWKGTYTPLPSSVTMGYRTITVEYDGQKATMTVPSPVTISKAS